MLFKDIKIQIFRFRKSLSQSDLRDLFFGSAIKINFFLIDFCFSLWSASFKELQTFVIQNYFQPSKFSFWKMISQTSKDIVDSANNFSPQLYKLKM